MILFIGSTRSAWPVWTLGGGSRSRLLSLDDEDFVVQMATTRPTKLGQPFTRWSIRKLAAYPRRMHGHVIRISREVLRYLPAYRGVTFQRTKTWKESPDPSATPSWAASRRCWSASRTVYSRSTSSGRSGSGPPLATAP